MYLTNSEIFGRSTASSQYFLQLASYLGIPVIAWNADNSGLERRVSYEIFFTNFLFSVAAENYFFSFCWLLYTIKGLIVTPFRQNELGDLSKILFTMGYIMAFGKS